MFLKSEIVVLRVTAVNLKKNTRFSGVETINKCSKKGDLPTELPKLLVCSRKNREGWVRNSLFPFRSFALHSTI